MHTHPVQKNQQKGGKQFTMSLNKKIDNMCNLQFFSSSTNILMVMLFDTKKLAISHGLMKVDLIYWWKCYIHHTFNNLNINYWDDFTYQKKKLLGWLGLQIELATSELLDIDLKTYCQHSWMRKILQVQLAWFQEWWSHVSCNIFAIHSLSLTYGP